METVLVIPNPQTIKRIQLYEALDSFLRTQGKFEMIIGTKPGVERLATLWAIRRDIPISMFIGTEYGKVVRESKPRKILCIGPRTYWGAEAEIEALKLGIPIIRKEEISWPCLI